MSFCVVFIYILACILNLNVNHCLQKAMLMWMFQMGCIEYIKKIKEVEWKHLIKLWGRTKMRLHSSLYNINEFYLWLKLQVCMAWKWQSIRYCHETLDDIIGYKVHVHKAIEKLVWLLGRVDSSLKWTIFEHKSLGLVLSTPIQCLNFKCSYVLKFILDANKTQPKIT